MGYKHVLCVENVLCAAVGTARHQHWLEVCVVYGDPTVCCCKHIKPSEWIRSVMNVKFVYLVYNKFQNLYV